MESGGAEGEGVLELEVGFVQAAFLAGAVDAYDSGGGRGREQRKEVVDEAHANIVAERDGILQSVCVV